MSDEGLHRVLLLMGPGTIGMAATQINVFVNTMLATGQGTGAVSWLDFAFRLMYLPIGLFGVSIATAATPAMSRLVASQDFDAMRSTLAHAHRADAVPERAGDGRLDRAGRPIVAVIFEHGSFTPTDTVTTAAALQFYAIGLIGYSIVRIVSPTFYALGRSRIPVMVSRLGAGQRRAERHAGAGARLSRPGARHVDHGALNARRSCSCCGGEIHGIDGSRIAARFVARARSRRW